MSESISDRCIGRWPGLLGHFGVDARFLSGKHGPCPVCGGKDRFRFDDKEGKGTFICNHCGAGDGFKLLMQVKGWNFKQAATEVEAIVGRIERKAPSSKGRSDQAIRDVKNRLWSAGVAVTAGDPVARYLGGRGIRLDTYPAALRYIDRCRYQDEGGPVSHHHAMLAKVLGPDGKPVTIHRTYLDATGRKASVPEVRKVMPGKIPNGSAVRLFEPAPVMGIAEGVETALAAFLIWRVPCWAALNARLLATWEPPTIVEKLMVFGDNDHLFGGQYAAFGLAYAQATKRRERALAVEVHIPPDIGDDWNNALEDGLEAA